MMMEPEEAAQTKPLSGGCYEYLRFFCTLINKTISTFARTTNVEHDLFSLLPDEMVVNCLARISRSYYPKLCLVCKRFRTLIFSNKLHMARYHLETQENVLYVCLQLPGHRLPSWYSLWIKPDQTLTNDMEEENHKSTGNTLLVGIPSSYSHRVPVMFCRRVGSKSYAVYEYNIHPKSSPIWVRNDGSHVWREGPRMKVARENPVAEILDGKIYIMGGCKADDPENWAEVFDTKTQTWESLPDPTGPELRFSLIKIVYVREGNVYVSTGEEKDYFYDPKEGRWGVAANTLEVERKCAIENVWYHCSKKGSLSWYDIKRKEWRVVKGLEVLNSNNCCGGVTAIANYGGKLLILWDKFEQHDQCQNKNIWCCAIALERRIGDDQVWGNVEWASVVLTVPSSYVFLRCQVSPV